MLLSDAEIRERIDDRSLVIAPYDPNLVQPASVDVRLGSRFKTMKQHTCTALYPKDKQVNLWQDHVADRLKGFVLHPGEFCLATTLERVEIPTDLAAQVGGKSSLGRIGLQVHATAGFIDPGFKGQITLELSNVATLPIVLEENMLIAQLIFMRMSRPATTPYQGKYQNQKDVTESRYHLNYEDPEAPTEDARFRL